MTCDHRYVTEGCEWCEAELRVAAGHNYTDDLIEVMRATIDQLRKDVAELRVLNEQLRKDAERFQAVINGSPMPEGM